MNGENERANWSAKNDIFERNFDAKIMITFIDQKVYELSLLNIIKIIVKKNLIYMTCLETSCVLHFYFIASAIIVIGHKFLYNR